MATPVAAGAAALMIQANPKLTPNMTKMILMYTAQQLAGFNMLEQGAGELNIDGAVRVAKPVRQDLPASPALGTTFSPLRPRQPIRRSRTARPVLLSPGRRASRWAAAMPPGSVLSPSIKGVCAGRADKAMAFLLATVCDS